MILLDANILMYAAGVEHPHKAPSLAFLGRVATGSIEAGADVEVLQEILHRYRAIGRWDDGKRVFDLARTIISTWLSVDVAALDHARALLQQDASLSARDALHAAVCLDAGAEALCSYDTDFDRVAGLRRVEPADLIR